MWRVAVVTATQLSMRVPVSRHHIVLTARHCLTRVPPCLPPSLTDATASLTTEHRRARQVECRWTTRSKRREWECSSPEARRHRSRRSSGASTPSGGTTSSTKQSLVLAWFAQICSRFVAFACIYLMRFGVGSLVLGESPNLLVD
jgi:hypothetical protein